MPEIISDSEEDIEIVEQIQRGLPRTTKPIPAPRYLINYI